VRLIHFWLSTILAVILLGSAVTPLPAQQRTTINGFIWNKMKRDNKYYWLFGYLQGLQKADEIIQQGVGEQKKREFTFTEPFYVNQMHTRISDYLPPDKIEGIDQLIELLNAFYADNYNLRINVEVALRIVLARQKGQIEQADFWLNEARRALIKK